MRGQARSASLPAGLRRRGSTALSTTKVCSDRSCSRRLSSLEDFLDPNCAFSLVEGSSSDLGEDDDDERELLIEVFAASDLRPPEYRIGDIARGALLGEEALLNQVYVELQVGSRVLRTEHFVPTQRAGDEDHTAFFDQEKKMLFAYKGEQELIVRVCNKRHLASMVRGDPLIGCGAVTLGPELLDGQRRLVDVPIFRGGKITGMLSLRHQVFSPAEHAMLALKHSTRSHISALSEAAAAVDEAGQFVEQLMLQSPSFLAGTDPLASS